MPNPLRADPTRTTGKQKAYHRQFMARVRALQKKIRALIIDEDAFGIGGGPTIIPAYRLFTGNTRWQALPDPEKVARFGDWLTEQIESGFFEVDNADDIWANTHIRGAYNQGLKRGYEQVNAEALSADAGFYQGSKASFLRDAFASDVSIDRLKILYTMNTNELKGITNAMSKEMNRLLAEGIGNGLNPREVARNITQSMPRITRKRALTIARTEIVRAHGEGQLNSYERLGIESVTVMAEWKTAGDDRVCPLCNPLEGVVMTMKEARGLIPRHPNCRCAYVPANVGESGKGQLRRRSDIADAIEESLAAQRPKSTKKKAFDSGWPGQRRKIKGKKKPPKLF